MSLKDLLTPVMRILGRAAMDTAKKSTKNLAGPEPKRKAGAKAKGETQAKAAVQARDGRAAAKKARQAARVTRRRG